MARISIEDAKRLGIPGFGAPSSTAGRGRGPVVPGAVAAPSTRRKGGRIDSRAAQEPFRLAVTVPIEPKTKRRHRAAMPRKAVMDAFAKARGNAAAFAALLDRISPHTHTDPETKAYEDKVKAAVTEAMAGRPPYRGPVAVSFEFFLAGGEYELPTDVTDPDLDNLLKAAWDALNGTAWTDDRLVCGIGQRGVRKACSPEPRLEIEVLSLHRSATAPRAAPGSRPEAEVALA